MRIFRNKRFFRLFTISAVFLCGASVYVFTQTIPGGIATAVAGATVLIIMVAEAGKRYSEMEQLSNELDNILHDGSRCFITECEEGELAILTSTIRKMTVKLKEQATMLTGEKQVLTDAIADIFHQLRTPLTSLRLTCSMLSEEELSYEDRIRFVRSIKKQLERMQWLVETLLKMSKIEAGTVVFKKEKIEISELIPKACEALLIPLELRGITLKVDAKDATITGDPDWMSEAVANIVKNCMEHTPEGGCISIDAQENAIFSEIVIKDTGSGFETADIPHIFERFYKGKNSGSESVGIGLALCRTIITGLDGTIKAENAPEGGARFVIRFYKNIV